MVRGELRFVDGLRIDGQVHGDVLAIGGTNTLLVICEKARVCGKVKAGHVIITLGAVGPIHGGELFERQPKARVVGDVLYGSREIHHGVSIDRELRPLKSTYRPTLTLAASNDL